jgi:hypothetical protein
MAEEYDVHTHEGIAYRAYLIGCEDRGDNNPKSYEVWLAEFQAGAARRWADYMWAELLATGSFPRDSNGDIL